MAGRHRHGKTLRAVYLYLFNRFILLSRLLAPVLFHAHSYHSTVDPTRLIMPSTRNALRKAANAARNRNDPAVQGPAPAESHRTHTYPNVTLTSISTKWRLSSSLFNNGATFGSKGLCIYVQRELSSWFLEANAPRCSLLVLHSAQLDIFIEPVWIPGHTNVLADVLSRFNFD